MPNTLMVVRYGDPVNPGDPRPFIYRFRYPMWTLAAEPRVRMPYRMQVTPAVEGSYVAPLTRDPVVIDLDLALRERQTANRGNVGNPVNSLSIVALLQGQPLTIQWGEEIDWGDNWYLTAIDAGFRLPAQYPTDVGGSNPRDGGMVFDTIGVRISFTARELSLTAPVVDRPDIGVTPII